MKTIMTADSFSKQLQIDAAANRDFLVKTSALHVTVQNGQVMLHGLTEDPMPVNRSTLAQIVTWAGIGVRYNDRMLSAKGHHADKLVAVNINHWLRNPYNATDEAPTETRLIRTCHGQVRAFLSDSYHMINNFDLLVALAPVLQDYPGLRFESCHLSEKHMFIKMFFPGQTQEIKVGDTVMAGLYLRNSETGHGSTEVVPMSLRLVCLNGMTHNEYSHRKVHRTRKTDIGADISREVLADSTKRKIDEAYIAVVKDQIKSVLNGVWLDKVVGKFRAAEGLVIEDTAAAVVELQNRYKISEDNNVLILNALMRGDKLTRPGAQKTQFDLLNAITAASQQVEDYETATELEMIGGKEMARLLPAMA